ncbi:hypothetical protein BH11PLA1_BH11PLA1_10970 [soil metagenome]
MPTYDYRCTACGAALEEFQSMTAPRLKKCPRCGKAALERLIGTGAAVIFKGGGFYQTDYRSDGYKKAAEADQKLASGSNEKSTATEAAHAAETKGEAKPSSSPQSDQAQSAGSAKSNSGSGADSRGPAGARERNSRDKKSGDRAAPSGGGDSPAASEAAREPARKSGRTSSAVRATPKVEIKRGSAPARPSPKAPAPHSKAKSPPQRGRSAKR